MGRLAAVRTSLHAVGASSDGAGHIAVVFGHFDALLSRGLQQILNEDRNLQIIGTDLDSTALENTAAQDAPRVVLLDEADVVESSFQRLSAARPAIGIVVLAHRPTVAYAMRLMARGASCLAKTVSAADILAAVYSAADGRCVFVDVAGHRVERSCPLTAAASLTPREMEVLEFLSRGQSHAEIAHALQLGVETIRTHSAHIRGKLGVRSKRELIGLPTSTLDAT